MRKIKRNERIILPSTNLYIDQLERIIEFIEEDKIRYNINSNEIEFENWQEFREHMKESNIHELELSAVSPYFTLSIKRSFSELYVSYDKFGIAFTQIVKDEFKKNIKFYEKINKYSPIYILLIFFVQIAATVNYLNSAGIINFIFLFLPFTVASIYYGAIPLYITNRLPHTTIKLIKKSEDKNFLSKNKNELLLSLFSIIIGGIVTAVVTIIIK